MKQKQTNGARGECDSDRASCECEDQAFRQELANDTDARGSEGLTNGELASAGGRPCEKKISDVGTGDQ